MVRTRFDTVLLPTMGSDCCHILEMRCGIGQGDARLNQSHSGAQDETRAPQVIADGVAERPRLRVVPEIVGPIRRVLEDAGASREHRRFKARAMADVLAAQLRAASTQDD